MPSLSIISVCHCSQSVAGAKITIWLAAPPRLPGRLLGEQAQGQGGGTERQRLAQTHLIGQQQPHLAMVVVVAQALGHEPLLPGLQGHALSVHRGLDQRGRRQCLLGVDVRQ